MTVKIVGIAITAALLTMMSALPALGKENRVTRFGNPQTAFHLPALKSPEDARAVLLQNSVDVRTVLQKAGWAGDPADLFRAAQTGSFQVTTIEPGSSFPFIAMRRNGKPDVLWNAVWAGRESFDAYYLEFESKGRGYRLLMPRPCSNFWIEDLGPKQAEAKPAVSIGVNDAEACVTQPVELSVTVQNAVDAQVILTIDGEQAASGTATGGVFRAKLPGYPTPGSHSVVAAVGDTRDTATLTVKECPPVCVISVLPAEVKKGQELTLDASGSRTAPGVTVGLSRVQVEMVLEGQTVETVEIVAPESTNTVVVKEAGAYTFRAVAVDEAGQRSTNICEASVLVTAPKLAFFVDGLVGKERLVVDELGTASCDTIAGGKFGILPRLGENAEFEAAVGGKYNFDDSDRSSIFADVAINALFSGGFIGAGVSFWDLTLEETRTAALLIHGGFGSERVALIWEGRLPFDQFDDAGNNYQIWGGLRVRFGR